MFALTTKQKEANRILASEATHIMLFGGSRSGKTFLTVRAICMRALKSPKSRHAILRFRFNAVKAAIVHDTFPKVMELCFPGVKYSLNKTDWFAEFENGAQIWFGGLDDKERTEKILGQEYVTIYLNEASQIPWASRGIAVTRLAQACIQKLEGQEDRPLPLKMYYDCNPPDKGHWTYRYFIQKQDPETKQPLRRPSDIAHFQINPGDNRDNLPKEYLDGLGDLSERLKRRFLYGEFKDANPDALFKEEDIDKWRVTDGVIPQMVRIVIPVDPSGSGDEDNADNDAIGIIPVGLGTDGNAYVLEDLTVKAGPATWGKITTDAYDRHEADCVVGEQNYGGEMVKFVIQTQRPRTNYKKVTASRGKHVRAEPFSALFEQGKIRVVGHMPELEEELSAFSTTGYRGQGSPNRADALIWGLTELFPALVNPRKEPTKRAPPASIRRGAQGWMA